MPGCDPVQPDVLVIRAGNTHVFQEGRIVGIPALLIEVQSPSNPNYDSRIKLEAYAKAGVPEYWIGRPAMRDVLVNARPDSARGAYVEASVAGPEGEFISPTLPIRFRVSTLLAGAPDTTLERSPA
jgi:Uma2 family endonuclease